MLIYERLTAINMSHFAYCPWVEIT